ncbi:hypothetical protein PQG02_32280 (plasmid) [Nostoc sp. UHCC 0926]|uniref:hypothetical protein n=1 Tax=Nostoc sp. UHCC 0926 TaxID=3025190 RepID=UPI00235F8929|nr:hypothetical protein [Nostoc sp. UHCC 0926]WDD36079.1 hypothetical protein PQG02_32280 [Nostoc sp. UHCC 0926]
MNQKTFQIMYNALLEIASAKTFFDGEKKLSAIAKKALSDIVNRQDQDDADNKRRQSPP